jgi:hypothetical protein
LFLEGVHPLEKIIHPLEIDSFDGVGRRHYTTTSTQGKEEKGKEGKGREGKEGREGNGRKGTGREGREGREGPTRSRREHLLRGEGVSITMLIG